jgi:hypothetical protein
MRGDAMHAQRVRMCMNSMLPLFRESRECIAGNSESVNLLCYESGPKGLQKRL